MSAFAFTDLHIANNALNVSCFANQVEIAASADELDVTTFCAKGWRQKILGLGSFSVNVKGFQDYIAPSPGTTLDGPDALLGGLNTFTVSVPGQSAGDTAYLGQSRTTEMSDLQGSIGDPASFTFNAAGTGRLVRGVLLAPSASRTTSGNGTAVPFTPPTATQALYAAFHVHSVTGTGSIVFQVATDNAIGFPSPVTKITSQSFTTIGHQFSSLAGVIAGETHVRVSWTITGFSSVTFSVAAGVQ